jgi:glucose-1-phosphate adenylyltransferase
MRVDSTQTKFKLISIRPTKKKGTSTIQYSGRLSLPNGTEVPLILETTKDGFDALLQDLVVWARWSPPTSSLPDSPDEILASMGNYVFTTEALVDILKADAASNRSGRDIGGDLIPALVKSGEANVYDFTENEVPGETPRDSHYWRDVGTLDSYYEANMDLVDPHPIFNLYNTAWPVYNAHRTLPPAKIVAHGEFGAGNVSNSIISAGSIITGANVEHSVISPNVRIEPGAIVENSILFDDVVIGAGAVVKNAILDKKLIVPRNRQIGVDTDRDKEEFTVSDGGVVAVGKAQTVSYS